MVNEITPFVLAWLMLIAITSLVLNPIVDALNDGARKSSVCCFFLIIFGGLELVALAVIVLFPPALFITCLILMHS